MNRLEHLSYNAVGTVAAPATLTADITDNTITLVSKYFSKLTLDLQYTPLTGQTDRFAEIRVDVSNDGGTTYIPIAIKQNTAGEILAYVENSDLTDGNGVIIPGDKTSTGGTTYQGSVTVDVYGDHVKISARESGAANFGTLFCRATLTT